MAEVRCIHEAANILGEGPIWNDVEQTLWWCDNLAPKIQRYDPASGAVAEWVLSEEVGSVVFREGSGIVAAMKSGFAHLDLETMALDTIADPEPGSAATRLNDGKCDRRGCYWCGSMDTELKAPIAALYRLDPDGSCHRMRDGVIVSNGIAFSPDDRTMYFSDSRADKVFAFDIESGRISNERVFIDTAPLAGRVDGATVNAEGCYWGALIHDWSIGRFDPTGRLVDAIRLPVRHPTMCTFGGPNLDVLYVTTTRKFLEPGEAESQPLAGALFELTGTGAKGLPEPRFSG